MPCKTNILCKSSILCKADILCKSSILCGPTILCGPQIIPCGGKIACNFSISGCMAAIGPGCPAINPEGPWDDFSDIFKEAGVGDIVELAAKLNTETVKRILDKLGPTNRRALTLMLERISAE